MGVWVTPASASQPTTDGSGVAIDVLDRPRQGHDAVSRSGRKLNTAAQRSGLTVEQLQKTLETDSTAWLDRGGRLNFVEPRTPAAVLAAMAEPSVAAAAPFAYSQTFLLHSRAGSQRTIYLDFDGQTISGTGWNASFTSGASFFAEAYDTDGNPASFSNAEMEIVQKTWQRIAEDYAPLDVDVTTEAPALAVLDRSGSTDQVYGSRLLVTNTNTIYGSCGCGGISYVGVFDLTSSHETYQPALVFQQGTGSSDKGIAEAASHEVGHLLGLSHDGTASVGYYSGQGSWAPIMGVGYNRPVTQWSQGEYQAANNPEDDIAVMAVHGASARADDAGNLIASPTPLAAGTNLAAAGIISTRTDVDAYSFTAGAGSATITANAAALGANLDIKLSLYKGGVLVTTADPAVSSVNFETAAGLGASLTTTLTGGTYVVTIEGTGFGDPLTNGYSKYASLGQYTLTGTVPAVGPTNVAPTAVAGASVTSGVAPLAVSFSGLGSTDSDGSIVSYQWNFGNSTSASTRDAVATYAAAGTYTAVLTVTDNLGAMGTASVTVTVTVPITQSMHISAISGTKSGTKAVRVSTQVTLRDGNGALVSGVVVTGQFSGENRPLTFTTGANGIATFTSLRMTNHPGTITFTVTAAAKPGYGYASAGNTASSVTVNWV